MEPCAIYGLESQGRALCSHTGDQEAIRFYVGTLSPRTEGHVHQIDFDEETNQITKKTLKPKVGEIWQIQCSPVESHLTALTFNHITSNSAQVQAGIFQLPDPKTAENNQELKVVHKFKDFPDGVECRNVDWHPTKATGLAVVSDEGFVVWDLGDGSPQVSCSFKMAEHGGLFISQENERQEKVHLGKWNPHLDGNQVGLVVGNSVGGVDTRNMQKAWEFQRAHKFQIRDIDFNPNKQYYFATCGDDCAARFWDIRKPNECLKEVSEHSHWVWRVRYNSFHDQLVLTSGSDSRVLLHALPSISSEPKGYIEYTEGEEAEGSPRKEQRLEEGVLVKYEEHEDAVYTTDWSAYDPWIFASLSYDGRLVINRVPQSQKYKILL